MQALLAIDVNSQENDIINIDTGVIKSSHLVRELHYGPGTLTVAQSCHHSLQTGDCIGPYRTFHSRERVRITVVECLSCILVLDMFICDQ